MSERGEDRIERELAAAGEAWRAGQPGPPEPDRHRFALTKAPGRSRWRLWGPVATLAAVAAVIAAVALPLTLSRHTPLPSGTGPGAIGHPLGSSSTAPVPNEYLMPPDPGTGVRVFGVGNLFRGAPGEGILLCATVGATMDLPTSIASCGAVAVATTGADPARLTQTTTRGQAYSTLVRVEGSYHNGTLAVTSVTDTALAVDPAVEPTVPCDPPSGGWRLGEGSDDWQGLNQLTEYVRAHPDTLTDLWQGHPDGAPKAENSYAPSRSVYVVGTIGDVAAVRAELTAIWGGNLCVHPARHSSSQLTALMNQLRSISFTPMEPELLIDLTGIRVRTIALDQLTMQALTTLSPDGTVFPGEPLLKPVG
jgi:hypothetical protein